MQRENVSANGRWTHSQLRTHDAHTSARGVSNRTLTEHLPDENTDRKWVETHLPRNNAGSARSAPQDKRELADLGQPRGHDPLDVLAGFRQEERQDQCCQNKLRECPCYCLIRAGGQAPGIERTQMPGQPSNNTQKGTSMLKAPNKHKMSEIKPHRTPRPNPRFGFICRKQNLPGPQN